MKRTGRIEVLREELELLGYRYQTLKYQSVEYTKFISPSGILWLYKDSNGKLPFPYVGASSVLNDKYIGAEYAKQKGIIVPESVKVTSGLTLEHYRRVLGVDENQALVVKPADSTLSRGVSANVRNEGDFLQAHKEAQKFSNNIIVQQRFEGDEFRFVFVGKELVSVIQKQKLRVVGDGVSSVKELLLDENRARMRLQGLRVTYPQIIIDKFAPGEQSERVLEDGQALQLSDSTMLEGGASYYEVSDEIHQSYKEIAEKLAKDFGGGYLSVDIIASDYKSIATNSNYAFLEFNDIPAPLFFYACRNKPEIPVMKILARYIDKILHTEID